LPGPFPHLAPQAIEGGARLFPPAHQRPHALPAVESFREPVQQEELAGRLHQALVLVLAV
jgi:hypothetical protein